MTFQDDLYSQIYKFDNLMDAWINAKKGKTKRRYVKRFQRDLKQNLAKLHEELITQTYQPNPLKTFILRDPKTRKISKSAFRDRVIHHALCKIIIPLFQKGFIYDCHANIVGKGTLKAIERFDVFKRKVSDYMVRNKNYNFFLKFANGLRTSERTIPSKPVIATSNASKSAGVYDFITV